MAVSITVKDDPGPCPLTIRKGRDYRKNFTFTLNGSAMDLTGYSVYAQARKTSKVTSDVILNFTATHNDTGGIVTISTTRSVTEDIDSARGKWDLVMVDPSDFSKTYLLDTITFEDVPTDIG